MKDWPQVIGNGKYKIDVNRVTGLHKVAHSIEQNISLPAVFITLDRVAFGFVCQPEFVQAHKAGSGTVEGKLARAL